MQITNSKKLWLLDLIVFPTALVLLIDVFTPSTQVFGGFGFDGRFYGALAGEPALAGFSKQAPWCWRVLTPWIVSLLPLPTLQGFTLLAKLSCILNLALLYACMSALGITRQIRLVGMLIYSTCFWAVPWALMAPAYIDYQAQTFLLLAILLTLHKKYNLLFILIPLGVFQKESLVVFVFAAFTHRAQLEGITKQNKLYLAALLVVSLLPLGLLKLLVEPTNIYNPEAVLLRNFTYLLSTPSLWTANLLAMFVGLGLLPLVPFVVPRHFTRALRENWALSCLLICCAPLLFGSVAKARIFLVLLPPILLLSLHAISYSAKVRGILTSFTILHIAWGLLFLYMPLNELTPFHNPATTLPNSSIHLLLVFFSFVVLRLVGMKKLS